MSMNDQIMDSKDVNGDEIDYTNEFVVEETPVDSSKQELDRETDSHRISQRQRQIEFGKNTIGYQRYLEQYPKHKRPRNLPRTPDVYQKCSKRAFDGQIRKWRRRLHDWDLPVDTNDASHVAVSPLSEAEESKNEKDHVGEGRKGVKGTLPNVMTNMTKRNRSKTPGSKGVPSPMPDLKVFRWSDAVEEEERAEALKESSKTLFKSWKEMASNNIPTDDNAEDIMLSYSDSEICA